VTDYFVRKGVGSDAAAGTSPATAWATIGKALLAGSPVVGGDRVFLGAGVYREVIAVAITPASTVQIIGDVDGSMTGDRGEVTWSAYTTNDTSAPSGSVLLNSNGKSFFAISKIYLIGSTNPFVQIQSGSHDWSFSDCAFQPSGIANGQSLAISPSSGVAANVTVDRCIFMPSSSNDPIRITLPTVNTADFDYAITVQNCVLLVGGGGTGIQITSSGALALNGGGVKAYNNIIVGGTQGIYCNVSTLSTSIPACKAYNNIVLAQQTACLRATTSGQITEDFNRLWAATPRTNVTAGANSNSTVNHALLLEIGQSFFQGRGARPFLSPMVGSPLLAFGAQAGGPSVDLLNRARPGTYAVGPFELSPVFPGLGKGRLLGGES
jgi:hypothetical protein